MSPLLISHIALFDVGIGAFILAFVVSALVFYKNFSLKRKHPNLLLSHRGPSLEKLDRYLMRLLYVGYPAMTLALLIGFVLAHRQWNPGWASDPKIIMSLICWGWYSLLFVARFVGGWRGRKLAILNFLGFSILLLAIGTERIFHSQVHHYL